MPETDPQRYATEMIDGVQTDSEAKLQLKQLLMTLQNDIIMATVGYEHNDINGCFAKFYKKFRVLPGLSEGP